MSYPTLSINQDPSQSLQDYLETILVLSKRNGNVRSVDIAAHLEVSKPSVCPGDCGCLHGGTYAGYGGKDKPADYRFEKWCAGHPWAGCPQRRVRQ